MNIAQSINRRLSAPQPSEKQIHTAVVDHWRMFGLPGTLVATLANEYAHGQPGLTRGLPDLLVLGPSIPGHVGFIELKKLTGAPSKAQLDFQGRCMDLGIFCALTYGRDEPIYVLECWGVIKRNERRSVSEEIK